MATGFSPTATISKLSVAIVHHPCLNKNGDEVCATVSEYDVFDASRLSLAYPIHRMYIVNNQPAQRELVFRLLKHGNDCSSRADERGVFSKTMWAADLSAVRAEFEGPPPVVVATSARAPSNVSIVSFSRVRELLQDHRVILVVGKAWGLAQSVLNEADFVLEPIDAGTGYNHLSVRSALAILIDRLCCTHM